MGICVCYVEESGVSGAAFHILHHCAEGDGVIGSYLKTAKKPMGLYVVGGMFFFFFSTFPIPTITLLDFLVRL